VDIKRCVNTNYCWSCMAEQLPVSLWRAFWLNLEEHSTLSYSLDKMKICKHQCETTVTVNVSFPQY